MGKCTVTIEKKKPRETEAVLVVVQGKIDSLPLIGRPSLDELGMLKIDETGGLKEPNKEVEKIENQHPELEQTLPHYQNLFQGVGKVHTQKNHTTTSQSPGTSGIARTGVDLQEATYDVLQAYREMPQPATGTAPYELLMNREIRTRLNHYLTERSNWDEEIRK